MENIETVGSLLRRRRESKGLSLQEVMDATKITVQNLSALEEDNFDYFPNRVYTRAFLRDYSNYLGLDSGEILQRYEQTYSAKPDQTVIVPVKRGSAAKTVAAVLLMLIVIGGLAAAAYIYFIGNNSPLRGVKPPTPRSTPDKNLSGGATLPKIPVVPNPPVTKPGDISKPVPPVPVKPSVMTLQVAATYTVWTRVTADGKSQDITLKPGEVKTWSAKKSIKIRAGNAGALQLKWNGVKQAPLGPLGQPANGEFLFEKAPMPPSEPAGAGAVAPAGPVTSQPAASKPSTPKPAVPTSTAGAPE